eukprot:1338496-Heterocapsa_arctica.AAC.1
MMLLAASYPSRHDWSAAFCETLATREAWTVPDSLSLWLPLWFRCASRSSWESASPRVVLCASWTVP